LRGGGRKETSSAGDRKHEKEPSHFYSMGSTPTEDASVGKRERSSSLRGRRGEIFLEGACSSALKSEKGQAVVHLHLGEEERCSSYLISEKKGGDRHLGGGRNKGRRLFFRQGEEKGGCSFSLKKTRRGNDYPRKAFGKKRGRLGPQGKKGGRQLRGALKGNPLFSLSEEGGSVRRKISIKRSRGEKGEGTGKPELLCPRPQERKKKKNRLFTFFQEKEDLRIVVSHVTGKRRVGLAGRGEG